MGFGGVNWVEMFPLTEASRIPVLLNPPGTMTQSRNVVLVESVSTCTT